MGEPYGSSVTYYEQLSFGYSTDREDADMDDQTRQMIDDATAGLRHDPELRLDVEKELLTHLQQAAEAFRAAGCEDAEGQARKVFGSPLELAGELVSGNARRMKLRALARLALQALVVPAAIVLALWLGYGGLVRLQRIPRVIGPLVRDFDMPSDPFMEVVNRYGELRLSPFDARTQDNTSDYRERYYALLAAHPHDPRYYGYVITSLSGSPMSEVELRKGMQLDPDNALYPYLLSRKYLQTAFIGKSNPRPYDPIRQASIDYELKNRQDLERAIQEIRVGLNKPYLKDHKDDVVNYKMTELPAPADCAAYYEQTMPVYAELYPQYAAYRQIARAIPVYAELLIQEGRTDEALALLRQWKRLPLQMMQDSHGLIGVLVANAMAKILGKQTAAIYEYMGKDALAAQTRQELAAMTAPVNRYASGKAITGNEILAGTNIFAGSAGWIQSRLGNRSIVDASNRAVLTPQRVMGYKMMEEFALALLLVVLALLIIGLAIAQCMLFFRLRSAKSAPILLLPGWRQVARILLLGVLLPLAVYAVYSLLPIAGRGVGVQHHLARFTVEMLVLCGLLVSLPWLLTVRFIRRRCGQLGVPVLAGRRQQRDPRYRLYFGTVARSLIPIYALALLAVVLVCRPALHYQEREAYRQDRLFFVHRGEIRPRLEAKIADRLRSEVLQATAQLAREAK